MAPFSTARARRRQAATPWLQWHVGLWWSVAADRAFGEGTLDRESITWPGTATAATAWLVALHDSWVAELDRLADDDLARPATWPLRDGTLGDVVAWANIELMKNAAELGMLRFLYASRHT